ncbi:hypothetical protein K504DRAFT_110102 [Pleomassaria siparia CBS 279.74]|uniref:Uncharacterized protein n=1 Tax=Pleomassaria siparia CBS 279.74 TaxID=1314801 RepID=A0A6G1JWS4_9PLEO|nr:hypothetical protein K504DRAFT_110102 [Pleomassaria siparia CBS 279.74]
MREGRSSRALHKGRRSEAKRKRLTSSRLASSHLHHFDPFPPPHRSFPSTERHTRESQTRTSNHGVYLQQITSTHRRRICANPLHPASQRAVRATDTTGLPLVGWYSNVCYPLSSLDDDVVMLFPDNIENPVTPEKDERGNARDAAQNGAPCMAYGSCAWCN